MKLFRASAEDRIVKRVGIVLKAGGYKELEVDAEERLIDDSILSFPCLFDYLSKIPDIENGHADRWLDLLGFKVIRENYRKERDDYKINLACGTQEIELFIIKNAPARVNYPEASPRSSCPEL